MPAIITDLGTTVSNASWVLNSYSLVLAVFFLSMGRVADRYGQKRVFLFGLVTFTLFSLLCGLAPNIEWLIAFRAGQGLGGAALLTISLAIVLGAFPRRQQGTAVGLWGALGTAAAAVGPVLGGVLVTYGHWSWIFFVNVPIGILAVVLRHPDHPARRAPRERGRHRHPRHAHLRRRPVLPHPGARAGRLLGLDLRRGPRPVRRRDRQLPALHVVGDTHRLADVPGQAAAHPLVHGGQHRHHADRPRDGRHVPDARALPGVGAGVHRAARGDGPDGHAGRSP